MAYYEAATGTAWVGDVGGIRIEGGPALPVTPPPDIDVEGWKSSIERVMAWGPVRIVATHVGAFGDVAAHFAELRHRVPGDHVRLYETASGFRDSWWGLARYWRKRAQ